MSSSSGSERTSEVVAKRQRSSCRSESLPPRAPASRAVPWPAAGTIRRSGSIWLVLFYIVSFVPLATPSHHEWWEEGAQFGYRWFSQDWVGNVRDFYCDETCEARLYGATTIDREVCSVPLVALVCSRLLARLPAVAQCSTPPCLLSPRVELRAPPRRRAATHALCGGAPNTRQYPLVLPLSPPLSSRRSSTCSTRRPVGHATSTAEPSKGWTRTWRRAAASRAAPRRSTSGSTWTAGRLS